MDAPKLNTVLQMTDAEYRAIDAVSQSDLKLFIEDRELYHGRKTGVFPARETTPSMQFGKDVETLLFCEGHDAFVVIPDDVLSSNGQRRGKSWDAFKDDNKGKRLVTLDEMTTLEMCLTNIHGHEMASDLLERCSTRHPVVVWNDRETGLLLKAQMDMIGDYMFGGVIVDLKTSSTITPAGFAKQALDLGYHIQQAHYCEAFHAVYGVWPEFRFVVVKNKPGHGCEVFTLDKEFAELGHETRRNALSDLAACMATDKWKTVSAAAGCAVEISAPRRAKYQDDYDLGSE